MPGMNNGLNPDDSDPPPLWHRDRRRPVTGPGTP
jgi:hypothetical protein